MVEDMKAGPVGDIYPGPATRWMMLVLLIFAVLLAFVDRQILALLVEPVRLSLGLSDTQIGWLQGPAFALFYALAALPLGLLVDRTNRRNLIVAGIMIWSASTAACGLADGFWPLFAARVGVGLGEACLIPAVFSLIPDIFPPKGRDKAFGIYVVVAILGASLAMTLGAGAIAALQASQTQIFGLAETWRAAFVIVALPGAALAPLMLAVPEPSRKEVGMANGGQAVPITAFLRSNGLLILLVAIGVGAAGAVAQATLAWAPAILVRVHGFGLAEAGLQLGLAIGAASIVGGLCVAKLPGLMSKSDDGHAAMRAARLSALMAVPLVILSFLGRDGLTTIILFGLFLAPVFATYGMMPALVQSIAPNEVRGRIIAGVKLIEYLLIAAAALTVGVVSDIWSGSARGLQDATSTVLSVTALVAFAALWFAYRKVRNQLPKEEPAAVHA